MSPTLSCTFVSVDQVLDVEKEDVLDNDDVELEKPMGRKAEKAKWKATARSGEDIVELSQMKYTLLEESHAQEKQFFHFKEQEMYYDQERKEVKIRQEDGRLRLKVNKLEFVLFKVEKKAKSERLEKEEWIMLMNVFGLPKIQCTYSKQALVNLYFFHCFFLYPLRKLLECWTVFLMLDACKYTCLQMHVV